MELPQEQPQIAPTPIPVPPAPQNKSKKLSAILIISLIVIISAGGVASAYYFGFFPPINPTELKESTATTNVGSDATLNWVSASILIDANIGFTLSGNELYFKGERTQHYLDSFEVAVFGNTLSLPTYGVDKKDPNQSLLYLIAKDGLSAGGRDFDSGSFKVLKTAIEDNSCGYKCKYDALDKNYKYLASTIYPPLPNGANADTFSALYTPDGKFTGYARDKDVLYAAFDTNTFSLMSGAYGSLAIDANSFEALGGGYYKDKSKVYHETWQDFSVVKDADSNSIRYDSDSDVAKDMAHVYLYGRPISKADPASFVVVHLYQYYKDKNYVFETSLNLSTGILENADPTTFVYDSQTNVARDNKHAWIGGGDGTTATLVPNVDPKTFVALNFVYYKDARGVYYGYSHLSPVSADLASFKVYFPVYGKQVDEERFVVGYAVDKNSVYYEGKSIQEADVATFTPVSGPYSGDPSYFSDASDKNHKYKWGKVVE